MLQEAFQSEGVFDIQVRQCSRWKVVLAFSSMKEMENMLAVGKEWLHQWFEEVYKWEKGMSIDYKRMVWIKCYGVPLNVWNPGTFISIGNLWGEILSLDIAASKLVSFECGKIKVETGSMEVINKVVYLDVNGDIFPIRVMEDFCGSNTIMQAVYKCRCQYDQNGVNDGCDDDSSSSLGWSENREADRYQNVTHLGP